VDGVLTTRSSRLLPRLASLASVAAAELGAVMPLEDKRLGSPQAWGGCRAGAEVEGASRVVDAGLSARGERRPRHS